ncbi:MAG: MATE family efflux transporter [Lachnospira sp.]
MQTCIVPVISYNYAARNIERCKKTLSASIVFGMSLMALGTLCFVCIPSQMLRVFTSDELVIAIGRVGFRFVGDQLSANGHFADIPGIFSGGGFKP